MVSLKCKAGNSKRISCWLQRQRLVRGRPVIGGTSYPVSCTFHLDRFNLYWSCGRIAILFRLVWCTGRGKTLGANVRSNGLEFEAALLDQGLYSYGHLPEDSQLNGHSITADSEREACSAQVILAYYWLGYSGGWLVDFLLWIHAHTDQISLMEVHGAVVLIHGSEFHKKQFQRNWKESARRVVIWRHRWVFSRVGLSSGTTGFWV